MMFFFSQGLMPLVSHTFSISFNELLLSRTGCAEKGCGGKYNEAIYACTTLQELREFWGAHSTEKWNRVTRNAFCLHVHARTPGRKCPFRCEGYTAENIATWARQ